MASAIQTVVNGVAALTNTAAGILQAWKPFVEMLAEMAGKYSSLDQNQQTFFGNILGFAQGVNKIAENMNVITGALQLMSWAMSVLAGTSIINLIGSFGLLTPAVGAVVGALGPFQAVAAAIAAGWVIDEVLRATVPEWDKHRQAVADNVSMMHGADVASDDLGTSVEETGENAGAQKDI